MLKGGCTSAVLVPIPMTGARISLDRGRVRPPRLLIISISHQLQSSAGAGNDAGASWWTSWAAQVNGATSDLKY